MTIYLSNHKSSYTICGLVILLFSSLPTFGQQITAERQVLSASGNSVKSGDILISQTMGESFTESFEASPFLLSQGFEQRNEDDIISSIDLSSLGIRKLALFPNPASSFIQIRGEFSTNLNLSFAIYDAFGREIMFFDKALGPVGITEKRISLQILPEGNYFGVFLNEHKEILHSQIFQKIE